MDEYEKAGADRAVDLLARNKQLQAEIDKLKKYTWHKRHCKLFQPQALSKEEDCICGFFEL